LIIYFSYHYVEGFDYQKPFEIIKTKIKEILLVFIPACFSWVVAEILKVIVHAPRPFLVFSNIVQPLFGHGGYSFPSAHAMFFSALATSLYFIHKRLGKVCFIIVLIILIARIASGVHFPIDILFGLVFGPIIAFIFHRIFIRKYK
jgi:undecaprenyl-diphosphatase